MAETKAKYRGLRPISIQILYDEGACRDALGEFAEYVISKGGFSPTEDLPPDYAQSVAEGIGEPNYLPEHGFIEEVKKEAWVKIGYKDLHKIRPGKKIKRVYAGHEQTYDITTDPYWTTWNSRPHILVVKSKYRDGEDEYSINDLFNGDVYILVD